MRENFKLLVLAGAADPASPRSQDRYRLVRDEALKRGYDEPQVVAWRGQDSAGGGSMELDSASAHLAQMIENLEAEDAVYDVIAFSWGASVYLNTLSRMALPRGLRRTVLWGIDEYWRFSEYFLTEASTQAIRDALRGWGTTISSDFHARQVPNEVLLKDYPHSNPIRIGFGEDDRESPPAFGGYLKSFVHNANITYRVVPGAGHIVTEYDQAYLDCLFTV